MADDTFKLETASPVSNMNEMAIDNILARFFKSNGWLKTLLGWETCISSRIQMCPEIVCIFMRDHIP